MGRRKGRDKLKCLLCSHKKRKLIEKDILDGVPYWNIRKKYGPSAGSLSRHKAHIAQSLELASAQRGADLGESLLNKLDRMEMDFRRLSQRAELLGELPSAIVALRETRETLRLIHEMQQDLRAAEVKDATHRVAQAESMDALIKKMFNRGPAYEAEAAKKKEFVLDVATRANASPAELRLLRTWGLIPALKLGS
jgi:hypothetical protein